MNADLERLIALQKLDSAKHDALRRLAEEPERERVLAARVDTARQTLGDSQELLTRNQQERRVLERDLGGVQGRLSKYRDQLMEVKTNREYQTMQKEIEVAQEEVRVFEEKILERMLEADEIAAAVRRGEAALAAEQKTADAERRTLLAELSGLTASLDRLQAERAELVRAIDPTLLQMFESVANRRGGIAVAEARSGICTICHVRLRPQVFNEIRRNDRIIQCDSCQRILYLVPAAPAAPTDSVSQAAP